MSLLSSLKNQNSVVGLFHDRYEAEKAIKFLKDDGFRNSDICVFWPTERATRELIHKKTTKAADGVAIGSAVGAILGFTIFSLVWTLENMTFSYGDFFFYSFAGAGFYGFFGSILGFVLGMQSPRYEVKRYQGQTNENSVLVSAHVDNEHWSEKAIDDFKKCGGKDIGIIREEESDTKNSKRPPPKYYFRERGDDPKGIAL